MRKIKDKIRNENLSDKHFNSDIVPKSPLPEGIGAGKPPRMGKAICSNCGAYHSSLLTSWNFSETDKVWIHECDMINETQRDYMIRTDPEFRELVSKKVI